MVCLRAKLARVMPPFLPVPERARDFGLTGRELEALCLAAEGLGSKEAGALMKISETTVRGHLANAARKLGAHTTAEATARAVALGIIGT
jgi:DNA-binding CsgD family transcriptional regulator